MFKINFNFLLLRLDKTKCTFSTNMPFTNDKLAKTASLHKMLISLSICERLIC